MPEASPKTPRALYEEALLRAEGIDPAAVKYGQVFLAVARTLEPAVSECEAQPEDEYSRRVFWEYLLFRPDHAALPKEALPYFCDRLTQASSLVLRTRYAEICWDSRKESGIEPRESAAAGRTAAEAYAQLAVVISSQDKSRSEAIRLYDRATVLALELDDGILLCRISRTIIDTANNWLSGEDTRDVSSLADVLLKIRKTRSGRTVLADNALRALADSIYVHAQSRATWDDLELARPLLHVLSEMEVALGNQQAANHYLDEEAGTWETQVALVPQGAGWLRAGWYEQAADLYRKTGNRTKLGEMTTKMLDANNESVARGEYKSIAGLVEVPVEEQRRIWSKYTSGPDLNACLAALATDDDLLPSRETCEREVRNAQAQPSWLDMFSKQVYKGGRRILDAGTQDERLRLSANERMGSCTGKVVVFDVSPVFAILREKRGLTETSLAEFLESRGHLATESKPLLRQGIHHYFQSQFVAAIHILVPLIERTIRDICVRASIDVTPPLAGGYKAKTLETMLKVSEVERLLGDRVRDYLRFVLCGEAKGAMNLRNDVAHGFLRAEDCSQATADLVVFITLVLSRFSHQPGATVADNTEPSEGSCA